VEHVLLKRPLLLPSDWEIPVEIDGQGAKQVNAGDIVLIPAETAHLARNDSAAVARALVIHSRADKDKAFLVELKKPA